jgi:hypothetical protein
LKTGTNFLKKGFVGKGQGGIQAGIKQYNDDFCYLDNGCAAQVLVLERLRVMQETFSALSQWTSVFAGLVEADDTSLMASDFEKHFPFGDNPMASMLGGLLEKETEARAVQVKQVAKEILHLNLSFSTKKKKVLDGEDKFLFHSGKKCMERLSDLNPKEMKAISKLLDVPDALPSSPKPILPSSPKPVPAEPEPKDPKKSPKKALKLPTSKPYPKEGSKKALSSKLRKKAPLKKQLTGTSGQNKRRKKASKLPTETDAAPQTDSSTGSDSSQASDAEE